MRTRPYRLLHLTLGAALFAGALHASAAPRDLAREDANRRLVLNFYERFFNRHETIEAAKVVAEDYKQHNPGVPDGRKPFVDYFTGFFKDHPQAHAQVVRSAADGDLVYLHVHSVDQPGQRGQAVVDIFRVAHGRIVEHWDVIQDVPADAANSNGMF
ncbi:MAG: hypothetical protein GAK43_02614 [Stenotrophomonas maltophilia]|nr:MAG: hypothetical protein GAK43_02614 [Stenotrophomonas maltophilia]